MAVGAKHVMIEEGLPGHALRERAFRDRDHAQQEPGGRRIATDAESVPPVVHQYVEVAGGLDLTPPEFRDVDSIAGLELRDYCPISDRLEARISFVVGRR